jgi:hypothetical protein
MTRTTIAIHSLALLAAAGIALLAGACGQDGAPAVSPDGRSSTQDASGAQGSPAPRDVAAESLAVAFGLPRVIATNVYLSRGLLVEAVYQATALSGGGYTGQIASTGTLEPGLGGYVYSPQPADRLVVKLEGQVHEFNVKEAQGDTQALTASAWLMAPHAMRYTHSLAGQADVEIAARYDGASFSVEVKGWYEQSGKRYELELAASGRSAGQSDYHGQEVETAYDIKGKITADSLELDVDERHTSALASATSLRLPYSMRGSASRFGAVINNTLRSSGVEYKLQDVRIQTDMKTKGGESRAGLTLVEGEVLREGRAFGRCVLRAGSAILETDSGPITLDLPPLQ